MIPPARPTPPTTPAPPLARIAWRLSVPVSRYRAFRKMYEDAGVKTFAFKKCVQYCKDALA